MRPPRERVARRRPTPDGGPSWRSDVMAPGAVCRLCAAWAAEPEIARCPACGSTAVVGHPELAALTLAHLDCDAFFASVEKRDRPELADSPVIVGGGRRGAVMACCYIARMAGVRSAMPMHRARELCPDAVVLAPDLPRYRAAASQVRRLMEAVTPLVEPVSIDEAYLDLSGTAALHGGPPAQTLVRLARRIVEEVGIPVSVGLSFAKVLAKIASAADKPRGFTVVGRHDAAAFLGRRSVRVIPGVGETLAAALARDGIHTVADLQRAGEAVLTARYGGMGRRLAAVARGEDERPVTPGGPPKTLSAETTFAADVADHAALQRAIWPLAERLAARLKAADRAAGGVRVKIKTRAFRVRTRTRQLDDPTQLAERLYRTAADLVGAAAGNDRIRLVGIAATALAEGVHADPPNLLAPDRPRQTKLEAAVDDLRRRLGPGAIGKGRDWL